MSDPYQIPQDVQAFADGLSAEQREWLDSKLRRLVDGAARHRTPRLAGLLDRGPDAPRGWLGRVDLPEPKER